MLTSTKILLGLITIVAALSIAWGRDLVKGKITWPNALFALLIVFILCSLLLPEYEKAIGKEGIHAWNLAHPHSKPRHYE